MGITRRFFPTPGVPEGPGKGFLSQLGMVAYMPMAVEDPSSHPGLATPTQVLQILALRRERQ